MSRSEPASRMIKKFNQFRRSLAYIDALPQLTLLGLIVGVFTGIIIVIFRLIIDLPLSLLLPTHVENFEALSVTARVFLIMTGVAILAFALPMIESKSREISLSHVLDRMHNHQGKMPIKNWLVQFFGAAICLFTGQSVGREGPVVHLGAGAASQLGQTLKLPNNSITTLVACGVAAAISASFDTPLAGVIFAMELVILEYSIVGFVPVILASVMGTIISKAALGGSGFVDIPSTSIVSLWEMPIMILVGFVTALCAGTYIKLHLLSLKLSKISIRTRIVMAGIITCVAAAFVPEIMGLGYDTINLALTGKAVLSSLVVIAIVKLVVTPVVIGLGLPGGLIGLLLVIGACTGAAIGGITVMILV